MVFLIDTCQLVMWRATLIEAKCAVSSAGCLTQLGVKVAGSCVRSEQLMVLCCFLLTHCQQPQQPLQLGCLRRKLPSAAAATTPAAAVVLVSSLVLLVVLGWFWSVGLCRPGLLYVPHMTQCTSADAGDSRANPSQPLDRLLCTVEENGVLCARMPGFCSVLVLTVGPIGHPVALLQPTGSRAVSFFCWCVCAAAVMHSVLCRLSPRPYQSAPCVHVCVCGCLGPCSCPA
jgi:hypothetical protein